MRSRVTFILSFLLVFLRYEFNGKRHLGRDVDSHLPIHRASQHVSLLAANDWHACGTDADWRWQIWIQITGVISHHQKLSEALNLWFLLLTATRIELTQLHFSDLQSRAIVVNWCVSAKKVLRFCDALNKLRAIWGHFEVIHDVVYATGQIFKLLKGRITFNLCSNELLLSLVYFFLIISGLIFRIFKNRVNLTQITVSLIINFSNFTRNYVFLALNLFRKLFFAKMSFVWQLRIQLIFNKGFTWMNMHIGLLRV